MKKYNIFNDNTGKFICREKPGTEDQELSDSYTEFETSELLKDNPYYLSYPSATPLKDAWAQRLTTVDINTKSNDFAKMQKGDYVHIKTPHSEYFGFIVSKGRVNVVISSPYSPRPGDYNSIQELKFPLSQVYQFAKLKGDSKTTTIQYDNHGWYKKEVTFSKVKLYMNDALSFGVCADPVYPKLYCVFEISCGGILAKEQKTKQEAITEANRLLALHGLPESIINEFKARLPGLRTEE